MGKTKTGFHKLNFDGSKLDSGVISIGFVIRNHCGEVISLDAKKNNFNSVIKAEAFALKAGLQEAIRLQIKKIEIEGDNLCVIRALQGLWSCPWDVEMIISDSRLDLCYFDKIHIRHVFREINCVADRLTHLGNSTPNTNFSEDPELRVLIRKDALGWTTSRR